MTIERGGANYKPKSITLAGSEPAPNQLA